MKKHLNDYSEYLPGEKINDLSEANADELTTILEQELKPKQFYTIKIFNNPKALRIMEAAIATLKKAGLDIGKGETIFGYKMPIPKKEDAYRQLIIYRRK